MKKIVIISVYLGKMPNNYRLFLKSIEKNPTIDFKIFTDQKMKSSLVNLEYKELDLEKLNKLVKEKLGGGFNINGPYKCCDYKPVYGVIFEDYIKKYDFWGHSDIDLIFGDLRKFITDDMLKKYDKILPLGHLSLYRNTKKVNNRYKEKGSLVGDYREVFSSERGRYFDEQDGIGHIYVENKYPFYDKRVFADISFMHKRFKLAFDDKNYKNQVFYWEDGHVYRAFECDGIIKKEEFVYIHFKNRNNMKDYVKNDNVRSFYICDHGFIEKRVGLPSLGDIKKYNRSYSKLYEYCDTKYRRLQNKSILYRYI